MVMNKKLSIINIIKQEYKTKKSILIIQVLYNFFVAVRPFIYIYFPPLVIDYLIANQINKAYICIILFSALSIICDLIIGLLYVPYSVNGYILPHQFNKTNLLHLLEIDYKYTQETQSIKQYNNSLHHSWQCSSLAYSFISVLISSTTSFIFIILIMSTLDFYILLFILFMVVLNYFINIFKIKTQKKFSDIKNELNRNIKYDSSVLLDLKYGKEIRLYPKLHTMFLEKYQNNVKKLEQHNYKERKFVLSINLFQSFLLVVQNSIIYIIMIYKYAKSLITFGMFFMYINTANQIYQTLTNISNLANEISTFKIFAKSFNDCQNIEKKVSGKIKLVDSINSIEFKNVSFTYPDTKQQVLKNISFKIHKNYKTYLVGDNGSGKSTILKLILGLYSVDEGEILINGININEYDYNQYLKKFSIVFQDYKLYNLTIKENICFDCFDNIKFNETIKKCDLETIINQLDDKENTYIDKMYNNSGVNFSGGELQKIAIARAVYRKGDVYIFDEPTSSLDPLNEHDILKIYTKLTDNHLSLIISHRMSVASLCDEIIVIDGGKIIEKGTFDELIDKRGMFYKKYNMQASLYK